MKNISNVFCGVLGVYLTEIKRIVSILTPVIAVALGALCTCSAYPEVREPAGWDCIAWREQIPSVKLSDVKIAVSNEKLAWGYLYSAYCVRPVRVDYAPDLVRFTEELNEISNRSFSFQAESCSVGELLDALAARYERNWVQDEETGVLWVYPVDFDLEKLDRMQVEVESPLFAVPMRSGVLDPYFERKTLGGIRLQLGPSGIIRGQYPVYRFAEYPVDIPSGTHSLRDVLNIACSASPTQAFLIEYFYPIPERGSDRMSAEEITLSTDSIERYVPFSAVLSVYASHYLGVADEAQIGVATLGQKLSSPEPTVRRAAQHYVEMTEESYYKEYQPHAELSLTENLWYALAYDRYDKMSHEGYPRVSKYMLENVSDEFLLSCLDNHLVLLLALERARIERDYSWLQVLRGRRFEPEQLHGLEHEVLYIARRCERAWNALRHPEDDYYIDTGGWAASFMDAIYPAPYHGQSWNRPHPRDTN